jgi:3-methyladenine DNA glycosylase AlkD
MASEIVSRIRTALKQSSDEKTRKSSQAFFKEKVRFYGVRSAAVGTIGREHFRHIRKLGKNDIFTLCEELLKSGYFEESMIAFAWAERLHAAFEEKDFAVLEGWLKAHVNNWAACDTLCNHAIGSFIETFPGYIKTLKQWAHSKNRWERRAAAVTLILPARHGKFLKDIFEIADILLLDEDDLVQKGYGWMLKEASKKHPKEIFDFVTKHKNVMPRTALRYAIEKMPGDLRKKAMEK